MFFQNMSIAAQQVIILYLLVAVGFLADRLHIFSADTAKKSNNLLFYVTTPIVIIQSFMSMEFSAETAFSLLTAFACMMVAIFVGIFLAMPFFKKEGDKSAIYKFAVSYGNMGYLSLPLCEALYGDEGVFYCSMGIVAFNIVSFTHGIWLMTKDSGDRKKFDMKKLIANPGMISFAIGLPLFIFGFRLPAIPQAVIMNIKNLNTPLAMIFLGTYIANTDLLSMFKEKANWLASLLKLVVLPFIMMCLFKLIGISDVLLSVCVIGSAAPSANNTVMFSAKYGKDTGTASKIVALSSLLSVVTIPLMIAISNAF